MKKVYLFSSTLIVGASSVLCMGCALSPEEALEGGAHGPAVSEIDHVRMARGHLARRGDAELWDHELPICFKNDLTCAKRCSDWTPCVTSADCGGGACAGSKVCDSGVTCNSATADCKVDDGGPNSTFALAAALTMDALRDTWETASDLHFEDQGVCPANPNNEEVLVVQLTREGPAACGMGRGNSCTFGTSSLQWVPGAAVHEIGHGLGLDHEHQRPGAPTCPAVADLVAACEACQGGSCSAANYNGCLGPEVPAVGWQTLSAAELHAVEINLWNNGPDPEAKALTKYDERSVMNYCSGRDTPGDYLLTSFDALGAEILYPRPTALGIACNEACFSLSTLSVLRNNGSVRDEWSSRGALPWWEGSGVGWTWGGSPLNSLGTSPILGANQIPIPGLVGYSAAIKWNNRSAVGTGVVVVSDEFWTAVATSFI